MKTFCTIWAGLGILLVGLLGSAEPAAAQCHGSSHGGGHHGSGGRGGVAATEHNNRLGLQGGALLARDGQGTFFSGIVLGGSYFVGPRVQVGGWLAGAAPRPIATNFGYEATGPTLKFTNLGLDLRYMLGNSQRWRLDALGGPGRNLYLLNDQDRLVTNKCGCSEPALVAWSTRLMFDVGLGLTYKLWQHLWLTSDLRYTQVLGSAPFGSADLQSQWQLSVAIAVPSGFVRHVPAATPTVP